ncbi:MAG: LysM peptidoglycan-binding domain-containing protein, partial [Porticoccaceae bacterium]|nr:LysM peptidoglycan-binding domain-containing protein [Porticoccaceae bacterium]
YPPVGTLLLTRSDRSPKTYVVVRGDTLSHIAQRNGISAIKIQRFNGLSSPSIRVGQTILIPSI